ncbi:MAG: hypothetical protein AAFS11_10260 [Planctomycetota bacterium]
MSIRTRGLTLLETLLALSMLSIVAGLVASMTMTATRSMPEQVKPVRWESAAAATLQEIDRALQSRDRSIRVDRVLTLDNTSVSIARSWGTRVAFRLSDETLARHIENESRVLIGDVGRFAATMRGSGSRNILTITIESTDGDSAQRSWEISR